MGLTSSWKVATGLERTSLSMLECDNRRMISPSINRRQRMTYRVRGSRSLCRSAVANRAIGKGVNECKEDENIWSCGMV